jgi:hypothetical protein
LISPARAATWVIVESVWPSEAFIEGMGINALTAADEPASSAAVPSTTTPSGSGRRR